MAQTKRIHCVSDHEPASYHNTTAYAVNLNIECESGVIDASETAAAREAFGHFLDALPRLEFHVYEVKAAAAGSEAHHIASLPAAGPPPKAGTAAVLAWLDGLNPGNQDSFWLLQPQTAAILDRKDRAIEQAQVKATHLLRGSHSWSAPVGHGFGLTRLLDAAHIGNPTQRTLIVLPHDPDFLPTSPITVVDVGDERWDAKYAFDGALGDVVCRSNMLKTQVVTLPFLTPEGFLKVNGNAMELRRFLDAFERGWTGVVASLPAVLSRSVAHDKLAWTIAGPQDSHPDTGTFVPDVPAWRVIAGLTAGLDPMLIALLRPGSAGGDGVAGDLLLPLVNDVLDAAAEMPPNKLELTAGQVVGALRDVLRLSPLLKSSPTRKEFIAALRDVHGLGAVSDGTNAAGRLVDILLNAVADGVFHPLSWDEVKALAGSHSDKGGVKTATGFAQDPYDVVMDATHRLHEEAGAERAVLRLFAFAAAAGGSTVPDLLWKALVPSPPADDADHAEFRRKLLAAWTAYGSRLEGSFNGEEAIRRSAGADFLDVLLRAALAQHAEPAPANLIVLLEAADFFAVRIADQKSGLFGGIASTLPKPMLELLGTPAPDLQLGARYADMLASLRQLGSADAAFVADDAPAPLPIQVSASLGTGDLDKFSADFNGICIALRRIDTPKDLGADAWSHANLALFSWKHGTHEGAATGLRQWLPAVQDTRAPAFIDYEGFPFASRTVARVTASNVSSEAGRPFYEADVAEEAEYENNDWAPLPRLIYGRKFEAFSFATTNSGSLPEEIQRPNLPWMPKEEFAPVNAPLVKADYNRRTNIGTVSIDEDAVPARFGVAIAGVRPLAADYPRIALSACKGSGGSVDLLREPDGSGVLSFPADGKELHVNLADFQWTGGRATVRLLFFDKAALIGKEEPVRVEFADFDPSLLKKQAWMTLTLSGDGNFHARLGSEVPQVATRTGAQNSLWWIRIQLESDACVNIAFADPFTRSGAQGGTPLLLMAPSHTDWKAGLSAKVSARIGSPRVGFLDFERWYGNPALRDRTFENATASGARLLDWLLLAYVRRKELIKTGLTANFSSALDRLPDPAVEVLRVELVCLDTLNKAAPQVPASLHIDLKKRIAAWAARRTTEVENIKLPELRNMFEELAAEFSLKVEIESTGAALRLDQVAEGLWKVNVPAGVVAELRVSPLVPKVHFEEIGGYPQVIHAGVAQTAVRDGDWYVFPGDALRIETMLDGLAVVEPVELASRVISCRPQALAREYSVISDGSIVDDEDRRRWRLVSDAAVATQRWRPGGLPVYNMIDPRDWEDGVTQGAAVPVRNPEGEADDALRAFENEIFLARAAEEAETLWKSIDPQMPRSGLGVAAAACTVLQSIPWEAPSATYMRHRFQLRSRYAGALASLARGTALAWPAGAGGPDAWTRRVAMLADRSRVLVTRPQMRALMPLTTSPHEGGTPPIIGFMQEPPFSEGGLADRVAAELKLGFGFGSNGEGTVGILDARKEFGPDPRIDYRRIPDSEALAFALVTEGPVGLTFDTPRAGVATFSNSIISMAPARADGKALQRKYEEHFIGVSLRRYLAPGWLSDQVETTDAVPGSECRWFELAPRDANPEQVMLEHGSDVVLRAKGSSLEVRTAALDKSGSDAGVDWVAVAPHASGGKYAVLHFQVAPGRYSASLFLKRDESVSTSGATNQHLLVASFEWSLPEGTKETTVRAPGGWALHCVSSMPTFLTWSRTARDFRMVPIEPQKLDGNNICEELPAEDLVARVEQGTLRFETRPGSAWMAVTARSSTARSKFPLHVHRHLAVVGTRVADGLGKPVHVFADSAMVAPQAERFAVPANFANATQLHLVEYESPAAILGAAFMQSSDGKWVRGACIPAPYATSYFDLTATGAAWDRELRLFVRFVSEARKDKFANLGIRIEWPDETRNGPNDEPIIQSQEGRVDFSFDLPQDRAAVGAELLIWPDGDVATRIAVFLVQAGGRRQPVGEQKIQRRKDPGFLLSLAASGEFWTDISMLHFPKGHLKNDPEASPFSFELLFSPASDDNPADAVQAAALATMVEAQARIVSVSSPIRIVR